MARAGWIASLGLGIAALALIAAVAPVSGPQSGAHTLSSERAAFERARAQAERAKARSETLEKQAQAATAEAEKARRQARALAARIQQAEAEIDAAEARLRFVSTMQRAQSARLAKSREPIARLTAALQTLARRPTALALVQPGSVEDMVHVRAIMASVIPRIEQRTRALRSEVDKSRRLRLAADNAAKTLRARRADLAGRREALARLESRRRVQSRQLVDSARFEEERALGLGEQARDIGELMERLEQSGSVRERLAALDGPVLRPPKPQESRVVTRSRSAPSSRQPAYRLPAIGRVVAGLGELSDSGVRSRGITIATRPSAQVVAPAGGRIAFSGDYKSFGRIIIIEHEAGWTSLITNLAQVDVQVGDTVGQGDPIGRAGRDRPMITVELRRKGRPIDIVPLLG